MTVADPTQRLECQWCHAHNLTEARSCSRCGAPLDVRNLVSDSGWRETPRLRDLTEFAFSHSTCQVGGEVVPVVEVTLDGDDTVYFEHHVMLWKEESVAMSVMSTPGGLKRLVAGMPFVLSVARGPGRLALSRDAIGELVVLPLDPSTEIDVREHALLMASGSVTYSFERLSGLRLMLAAGSGMYLDRFVDGGDGGLVVLHGYGNVLERNLHEGDSVLVEPGAFLYKEASVTLELVRQDLGGGGARSLAQGAKAAGGLFKGLRAAKNLLGGGGLQAAQDLLSGDGVAAVTNLFGGQGYTLLRLSGPGRVGIQSMSVHHGTD